MRTLSITCYDCGTKLIASSKAFSCEICEKWFCDDCLGTEMKEDLNKLCRVCYHYDTTSIEAIAKEEEDARKHQEYISKLPTSDARVYFQLRPLVERELYGYGYDRYWVDIVTLLAMEAANYITMDPTARVKIKCVTSGAPQDSNLVKGIVCSKDIHYHRLFSQCRNMRMMLLAGSLESQRVAGHSGSFDTVLPQEMDHLATIMAQINTLNPYILLVEKSVSTYAWKYLLNMDIPLVLDVKRPLLEHIARCTGAQFCVVGDASSVPLIGKCELFRIENVMEPQRRKALMYFEGCPRSLGCTILLRGSCRQKLKEIKQVAVKAVHAAYNLVVKNSLLEDVGAPQLTMPSSSETISSGINTEHFGLGRMVVSFTYSPTDIHTVDLPPSEPEFNGYCEQEWIRDEAAKLIVKVQTMYEEIFVMLDSLEARSKFFDPQLNDVKNVQSQIRDLKEEFEKKRDEYSDALQRFCLEDLQSSQRSPDILDLNRLRCTLVIGSRVWDNEIFLLKSQLEHVAALKIPDDEASGNPSLVGFKPKCISSASQMADEAWMLIPHPDLVKIVTPVYKDDPGSAVSYALSSIKYEEWIVSSRSREGASLRGSSTAFFLLISEDVSAAGSKMNFFVKCYYATQFESLRRRYFPSEVDFVRSLSRCKKWNVEGGKSSKVYFAKSLDDRFIIKELVKTELECFNKFSTDYFKYLEESFSLSFPTCFAKILGIYQICVKNEKKDFMVMENLFYKRRISNIYDLKVRDTSVEEAILVESKAKRMIERAIWTDTAFLSTVDVTDYSLLVGFDEGRKELVLGIIDYLRQYTLDKENESVLEGSEQLGGPTMIAPKDYKKSFRKAVRRYFAIITDPVKS